MRVRFSLPTSSAFINHSSFQGYTFRTAISIGQAHPRLVFEVAAPEPRDFFIAYFSSGGRKFTLVNPPNHVDLALAAHLKKALGRKLATEHVEGSNLRIIEVKKKPGGLNGGCSDLISPG
jgi:hypothetical protein